jgi:hypothetical protein
LPSEKDAQQVLTINPNHEIMIAMKNIDSAIDFTDSLFSNKKCSKEASLWLSIIVQAVIDLTDNNSEIRLDARSYLKGETFKQHLSLLNLEFSLLSHCFTGKYLSAYGNNKKRREKYANKERK